MAQSLDQIPYSRSDRIILCARGVLTAALLTALVAAFANWINERIFAPELYAAGHPLARAVFVMVLTFPFILGGLLVLGIPAALCLWRFRVQNILTYALAGVVTGILWGVTVVAMFRPTFGITPHIVDATFGSVSMLFWWGLRPRQSSGSEAHSA